MVVVAVPKMIQEAAVCEGKSAKLELILKISNKKKGGVWSRVDFASLHLITT